MVQREANTMKLLTIALWFDSEQKRGRWGDSKGTEVQDDLRAIAMDYAALERRRKESASLLAKVQAESLDRAMKDYQTVSSLEQRCKELEENIIELTNQRTTLMAEEAQAGMQVLCR